MPATEFDQPLGLRDMELEDLDSVLAIETACQLTPWSSVNFRDCLAGEHYLCRVATLNDVPVAFLVLSRILDESHVMNLAVEPGWQRRGLARHLMEDAIGQAGKDGMTVMYLEVRASNGPARELYRRLGFRETGRRPNYYRRGDGYEEAVLMTLLLNGGHK